MEYKSLNFSQLLKGWPRRGVVVLAVALAFGPAATAAPIIEGDPGISPLPLSLAAHYPPASSRPDFLMAMIGLQETLSGIVVDLSEEDPAAVQASFAAFAAAYRRTAAMVPEWRDAYPSAPLEALGTAVDRGDRNAAMAAVQALGGVCHTCHLVAMAPVQYRFRWARFADQVVDDPQGGPGTYVVFKQRLATNLSGVTHDLRQGEIDNARQQFAAFRERFAILRESCTNCHATPRPAYVDPAAQALVDDLGRALAAQVPDVDAVTGLADRLGRTSCSACHLVHVPAALAQAASHGGREVPR